ncbi:hypothetical protein PI23P_03527 [Polaribacter irgensii 23-P]|uniref:Uncharacterized protein n=1 Tax=Polaribacter irgensii 23-P TaxID=313594 RepID=A4BX42_9FLAO|nr:hypothetical protein [Polaribacter irgensii]EAR13533.1 hypothetical protein PI23P_03527 [Polaribacter irgensii 23-P]
MKNFVTILLMAISIPFLAQEYKLKQGYLAEGYIVASYFLVKRQKEIKKIVLNLIISTLSLHPNKKLKTFKGVPKKQILALKVFLLLLN